MWCCWQTWWVVSHIQCRCALVMWQWYSRSKVVRQWDHHGTRLFHGAFPDNRNHIVAISSWNELAACMAAVCSSCSLFLLAAWVTVAFGIFSNNCQTVGLSSYGFHYTVHISACMPSCKEPCGFHVCVATGFVTTSHNIILLMVSCSVFLLGFSASTASFRLAALSAWDLLGMMPVYWNMSLFFVVMNNLGFHVCPATGLILLFIFQHVCLVAMNPVVSTFVRLRVSLQLVTI